MLRSTLVILCALGLSACAPESTALGEGVDDANARAAKVDVCHQEGDGSAHGISISERAWPAHEENHGDWLITEEVCGDGMDNDCDGDVDEDCCPCWDRATLDARVAEVTANPYWEAECYDPFSSYWGLVVLGFGYDDAGNWVDYGGAGVSLDGDTCLIEWFDDTGVYGSVAASDLTEGEAADCYDVLAGAASDYGLVCE